jgi:predicted cupin superfamily sugar epimerase
MLFPDGTGKVVTAGSDLAAGQRPQLFLPCGTFHTSRLEAGASYALLDECCEVFMPTIP